MRSRILFSAQQEVNDVLNRNRWKAGEYHAHLYLSTSFVPIRTLRALIHVKPSFVRLLVWRPIGKSARFVNLCGNNSFVFVLLLKIGFHGVLHKMQTRLSIKSFNSMPCFVIISGEAILIYPINEVKVNGFLELPHGMWIFVSCFINVRLDQTFVCAHWYAKLNFPPFTLHISTLSWAL